MAKQGQIVILNGAPRAGKSSIARVIQERFDGVWMNLGVDVYNQVVPPHYQPGIGLRPGGERPDIEALLPAFYAALYESIAAHSRLGLNVVTDIGHHDFHSQSLNILSDCARRLEGLPVLFVGVRCSLDTIMERRNVVQPGREGYYVSGSADGPIPLPVRLWQKAVHDPGIYDMEVDTSSFSSEECAAAILTELKQRPGQSTAFEKIASRPRR